MFRLSCAAPSCQMRTYNFSDEQSRLADSNYVVSFHKFPADSEQRKAWINAAQQVNWKPSDSSCLCSLHFRDDCFDEHNQLYDHAVPTIFFNDFRAYIKSIVKNIQLEVNLESEASDDQSLKNLSPVVSENEEIIEYDIAVSDDDFEIECEEVLTEDDCIEPIPSTSTSVNSLTKLNSKLEEGKSVSVDSPISEKSNVIVKQSSISAKNILDIDVEKEACRLNKNITTLNKNEPNVKISGPVEVKNLQSKEIQNRPSETGMKLFSMIQSGSFNKFSVTQPASRNLVCQLLNIVKLANAQNTIGDITDSSIPNTYIITTKQENKDPNSKGKVTLMETSEIVTKITNTVKAIKDGVFQKTENISIICGSPAIFFIKNIIVKNFDQNMNSVYVITSENLLPYLYQLSTKIDTPKKLAESNSKKYTMYKIFPESTPTTNVNNLHCSSQLKSTLSPSILRTSQIQSTSVLSTVTTSVSANSAFISEFAKSAVVSQMSKSPISTSVDSVQQNATTISVISQFPSSTSSIKTGPHSVTSVSPNPRMVLPMNGTRQNVTSTPLNNKLPPINISLLRKTLTETLQNPKTPNNMCNVDTSWQNITSSPKPQSNLGQSKMKLNLTSAAQTRPIIMPRMSSKQYPLTLTIPGSLPVANSTVIGNVSQSTFKFSTSSIISTSSLRNTPAGKSDLQSLGLKFDATRANSTEPPVFTIDDDSPPSEISNARSVSQKRKLEHESASESEAKKRICDPAYLQKQKHEIQSLERNIIKKETEIIALRKKIQKLKKRYNTVKNPVDAKTDEQLVDDILKKYLDQDAVQFFVGQMKVSGKTYTQFRWTEEDKLFALSLLYKNPVEYHILFQRFTLPSDKTLNKFVARIKKAEMDVSR